jgi:hypothetical protein
VNPFNLSYLFRANHTINSKDFTCLLLTLMEVVISRTTEPRDCNRRFASIFGEETFTANNLQIQEVSVLK